VAVLFATRAADMISEATQHQGARTRAALISRNVIAMAQGVQMSRLGVSAHDATVELRRTARDKQIIVRAEAVAVLASTFATGTGPGPGDARP
jgi:AmiR/NasT family two-component response regulator